MAIMCTEFIIYDVHSFLYTQKYTDYPSANQTMFVSWCSLCSSKCFKCINKHLKHGYTYTHVYLEAIHDN